jgi:anti-sigma regulatory factor (Ser/Thr protein kinase)
VRTASVHAERVERLALPASADSVRAARRFVREVLTEWQLDDQLETATLLASELVANAVVHAATPFDVEVCVDLDQGELVVAVTDLDTRRSSIAAMGLRCLPDEPDLDAESGRGLLIVARLADRWHVDPAPTGKTVWFALSLDGSLDRS